MAKYSLRQIKESYALRKEWEEQFPVPYYFARPISFYLTFLIIRFTESPVLIHWIGFTIGILGCISFLLIQGLTIWPGIALLIIYAILDQVDGNIARVTKNLTYFGKFFDGVLGAVIEGNCYLFLGMGIYLAHKNYYVLNFANLSHNGQVLFILAGVAIICGKLYSDMFQGSYYRYLMRKQQKDGIHEEGPAQSAKASIYKKNWWHLIFVNLHEFNLQLVLLTLCAIFRAVDIFLIFFAIYYLSRAAFTMIFYIDRAQRNLN
jgi:phosphatidylglycerophosphate synthase